jgi:SNF2 family DNA or RNA helicase
MKQHALLASDMGLGKTIEIISIALLHNCKYNLVVTEAKLIGQFAGELKRIGIPYKIIDKYHDTKDLAKFNLIAYSKIWRKASPGKTFAKALKKRCHFVALDEAHNIKANDSKRALACRSMHPKHWLLSSGTPISNYPRNLFSLLVCALGDGTELNPYGYWTPYIGGSSYQCTSGTRQFREDFVTVSSYVSNQFDDTLDKGRCIREFPIIKDVPKWHDMLAPVMLRRCQDEPEVRAEVKIPEPEVHDVYVDPSPEHIAFYDLWLNTFAEWYQAQLDEEEAGGHSMDIIQLLVQLGKLQFISTIPQADKVKSDKTVQYNWTAGITNKQEKIIELAKRHIARGEKTIVYSERPDLLKFLSKLFKQRGIKNALFTGEQSITKRDKNLIDFKVNGTNLLLATTTCGGVGLNIPQANTIIFADQNYSPKITDQAIHRILRPQQKGTPTVYKLYNAGFIDEYLKQMQDVKAMGIDEAIDYKEHTFDPSQWLNMRDFTAKYLKDKGLL